MYKVIKLAIQVVIFLLTLILPLKLFLMLSGIYHGIEWTIPTLAILNIAFSIEMWKSLRGYKIAWWYFDARDKTIFFFSLTFFLIMLTLPIKERLPSLQQMVFAILGLVLNWVVIRFFGSDNLKARMFKVSRDEEN